MYGLITGIVTARIAGVLPAFLALLFLGLLSMEMWAGKGVDECLSVKERRKNAREEKTNVKEKHFWS